MHLPPRQILPTEINFPTENGQLYQFSPKSYLSNFKIHNIYMHMAQTFFLIYRVWFHFASLKNIQRIMYIKLFFYRVMGLSTTIIRKVKKAVIIKRAYTSLIGWLFYNNKHIVIKNENRPGSFGYYFW